MDKIEAFLSILVAAVAADGILHQKEAEVLKKHMNNQSALKGFDSTSKIKSIIEVIKNKGYEKLVESSITFFNIEEQESILAIAVDLAYSDSEICEKEKLFLAFLIEKLDLHNEKSESIFNSIVALNRDFFKK